MTTESPAPAQSGILGQAARGALVWGAGFTLARDVLQFLTMLVLVRHLTPKDYGQAALAQGALGLLAVGSFKVLVTHTYQSRDPKLVDWQAHFTAAAVVNSGIFCLSLATAWGFSLIESYHGAALPLTVLSFIFIIEIPANLRHAMVQVEHNWRRLRVLLFTGAIISSIVGLFIAIAGGGVWALIVPSLLASLPAVFDLFFIAKWRPDWSWSWSRYEDAARFGVMRMFSGLLIAGRQSAEQLTVAGTYDVGTLGVFSRSLGLATITAGRIGSVVVSSLYPVITRTGPSSEKFRRIASLVMQGVTWTTLPAAIFVISNSSDLVGLLYGPRWTAVAVLLPVATVQVCILGFSSVIYSLLLANNQPRWCLASDLFAGAGSVALMALLLPSGPILYLTGLTIMEAVGLAILLFRLRWIGGIEIRDLRDVFWPPLAASIAGYCALLALKDLVTIIEFLPIRVPLEGAVFSLVFVFAMRCFFASELQKFLLMAPGGPKLLKVLHY